VPLLVGSLQEKEYAIAADALRSLIDEQTMVVVSSDFTHHGRNYGYQPFTKDIFYQIRRLDSAVIEAILDESYRACDTVLKQTGATVCGSSGIKLLMKMIERGFLGEVEGRLTSYYTSGQVGVARTRGFDLQKLFENVADSQMANSVSYAGIIFTQQKLMNMPLSERLTGYEQGALLLSAREIIANAFKAGTSKLPELFLAPVLTQR